MDKGLEEIPRQYKNLYYWQKLIKVEAIYNRNKLVLSKNYMPLKTRDLEKYLKSSFSRLIFHNQLIKYSVFGITLSSSKYKKNSPSPFLFISWCFLKNEPITLFVGQFCKQNNICRNLMVSQYFRAVLKMSPNLEKTSVIVKWLLWC